MNNLTNRELREMQLEEIRNDIQKAKEKRNFFAFNTIFMAILAILGFCDALSFFSFPIIYSITCVVSFLVTIRFKNKYEAYILVERFMRKFYIENGI
jgi:magnesium-transporting ATPase (P-type)